MFLFFWVKTIGGGILVLGMKLKYCLTRTYKRTGGLSRSRTIAFSTTPPHHHVYGHKPEASARCAPTLIHAYAGAVRIRLP